MARKRSGTSSSAISLGTSIVPAALCSFIIPAFVLHGLERVAHLLHLREQHVALVREHLEARVDGVVAAQDELDVLADVPDGHAGLFHAADDL